MLVRFEGLSDPADLIRGKDYTVVSIEFGWYRIENEAGESALYPARFFSIVTRYPEPPKIS